MATQNTSRKAGNGKNKAKKTRNIVILVIEVLVLAMMLGVLWFVTKATDEDTGIQRVEIPEEEIEVNEGVEENENLEKYRTVALFGLAGCFHRRLLKKN